jgi:CRP-like cAMP-binding protein
MFGAARLGSTSRSTGSQAVDCLSDRSERYQAVLLGNELIRGNRDIAQRIMRVGVPASFVKDALIIEQGSFEDTVYFIVAGFVEVRINKRHIDFRRPPDSVGEMAAKKAGEARTADVIARSDKVEALAISGSEFRNLMLEFPDFTRNLDDAIDALSRRKILQLGETSEERGWSWPLLSAMTAAASAAATAGIGWLAGFSPLYLCAATASIGALVFVMLLLVNPVLRYRNLASAAGYALIGLIVYGSMSFALTVDGRDIGLPLIDFGVRTEMKLGVLVACIMALLALVGVCGHLDCRLDRSTEK